MKVLEDMTTWTILLRVTATKSKNSNVSGRLFWSLHFNHDSSIFARSICLISLLCLRVDDTTTQGSQITAMEWAELWPSDDNFQIKREMDRSHKSWSEGLQSIRWAWMAVHSSCMGAAHSTATRKLSGPYCHKLSPTSLMWHQGHVIMVDIDWSPGAKKKKQAKTASWTHNFVAIFYEGWYNTEWFHVKGIQNQWTNYV